MSTRVPYVISKTVPTKRVQGVRRGKAHPFESDNTPRTANAKSTQSIGLFKQASEYTGTFTTRKTEKQKAKISASTCWCWVFRGGIAAAI